VEQGLRVAELLQHPVAHDRHPLAQRHRLDLVVGDVDRRDPQPLVQPRQLRPHRRPQLRVEVRQRLIQEEHLRLPHQRPAHRHPLALPTRKGGWLALEERLQGEHLGRLRDPFALLILGGLAELEAEGEVVFDGHVGVEGVVLEHHGDVAVFGGHVVDDPIPDPDLALGDVLQAGHHPQGRALATARGTDEHHEVPIGDIQAEGIHRPDPTGVDLGHILQLDACHASFSLHPGRAGLSAGPLGHPADLRRPYPTNPSRNAVRGRPCRPWQ
jgi:hypothetical protein